ncbi:hypothetical protein MAR_003412 [Mya arenaria]|uniref:Uncharacterized protein n=1 Tax=Mya arenaria TaxID=6604 RepID=A0ABY7G900_MYAAR|nr:hypothetical protein MAR_003412 [Mya arenaria]
MSQQLRAAALLRQAAELLDSQPPTTTSTTSSSTSSSSINSTVAATARGLFGPYRNTRPFQRERGRADRVEPAVSYWTHKFSVVPRYTQETVPNREEKFKLHSAGLGEKKLTFVKNSNKIDFERTFEEAYPKLRIVEGTNS